MGEIPKKVKESSLTWYWHVLGREEEYVGKRVMVMEVPGERRRRRPKRRWLDNIKNDLSERELSGEEAQDRVKWRRLLKCYNRLYASLQLHNIHNTKYMFTVI